MAKTESKHGGVGQGPAETSRPAKPEPRIYWASAESYQIGNWQKEIKQAGVISQPESPLRFNGNTYHAETWEEIDFIEASDGFKNGIVECVPDIATAKAKTSIQGRIKKTVQTTVSVDSALQGEKDEDVGSAPLDAGEQAMVNQVRGQ